ncbi:MAG: hypothetical protein ABSB80_04980 [Methanoregula sp.]|jgi:hypothetical protein|uniref:hypothetical protein n=1 Tax=Methanoregula sp. TaxID=2052170 RepID=UPI003D0CC9F0
MAAGGAQSPDTGSLPSIHALWHCAASAWKHPQRQIEAFFLKDVNPPPSDNTVTGDYLFMKEDKHDWILQILFRFS